MMRYVKALKNFIADQFGLDFCRAFAAVGNLPRYVRDYIDFTKKFDGNIEFQPCLHDWSEEGGKARGEYFWQDIWVAKKIFHASPLKHVDIGSRFDGFVSHVACFRSLEVFDIRPIGSVVPGVLFRQVDIMEVREDLVECADSVSCLHSLEHFGLGRYGDTLAPLGYKAGLKNMARMVCRGGVFYLSVPVGQEKVYFNAHRVFDPAEIIKIAFEYGLLLEEFALVDPDLGVMVCSVGDTYFERARQQRYGLGIFVFKKIL